MKILRPEARPRAAILCAILAIGGAVFCGGSFAADAGTTARVIAGLQVGAGDSALPEEGSWKAYSQEVATSWHENEKRIGSPLRQWACQEVDRTGGATVFYPFSGPDLPWAYRLYPDAGRFVLVALEKAEAPPSLETFSRAEAEGYRAAFRKAWRLYGVDGFFKTNDLNEEAGVHGTRLGITGPLMAFAVRLGFEIEGVEPIQLELNSGELVLRDPISLAEDTWDSVRLTLRKGGRRVVVDYVRMDLSDESLGRTPGARRWIERMASNPTLLKAASHHPQGAGFSVFRASVLANAPVIVQDETGFDYGSLSQAYEVRLYGKFTRPNSAFDQSLQRTLAAAYQKNAGVKPLPFRLGYEKGAGSALQVAVRGPSGSVPAPRSCGR